MTRPNTKPNELAMKKSNRSSSHPTASNADSTTQPGKPQPPPPEARGAAGQLVDRRRLLARGLAMGMTVLCVGATASVGGGQTPGNRKDSLCGAWDKSGGLIGDHACGTQKSDGSFATDASCNKVTQVGDPTGVVGQDYDCQPETKDSSCAKPAGALGSDGVYVWPDQVCMPDIGDADCGLASDEEGHTYRDNAVTD